MKHCNRCGQDKDESAFWVASRGKNKLDWTCRDCRTELRAWYKAHPVGNGTGRKPRPVSEGMRWCGKCEQELPILHFTGTERTCKVCKQDRYFLRKYGITRTEYNEMIKQQCGTCAICQRREPIYIDHDHKTGKVRGILCQQCNTGLGYFFDDCEILRRAAQYLC